MTLVVNVRRLSPDVPYGRLCVDTQVHVTPFNALSTSTSSSALNGFSTATNGVLPHVSTADLEQRIAKAKQITNGNYNHHHHNDTDARHQTNGNGNGTISAALTTPTRLQSVKAPPGDDRNTSTTQLELDLRTVTPPEAWFRVIGGQWDADAQLYDVYTNTHNLPVDLDTAQIFELAVGGSDVDQLEERDAERRCYVNLKVLAENEPFPRNAYRTLEANAQLLRTLGTEALLRVRLTQRPRSVNRTLERIELVPTRRLEVALMRECEHEFKQFVVRNTADGHAVLLNQAEPFRLGSSGSNLMVTVRLVPDRLNYACVDAASLRSVRVITVAEVQECDALQSEPKTPAHRLRTSASFVGGQQALAAAAAAATSRQVHVGLEKFSAVVDRLAQFLVSVMALDSGRHDADRFNVVLAGKAKSGKTRIAKKVLEVLADKPYHCYTGILDCTQYKGKKVSVRFISVTWRRI